MFSESLAMNETYKPKVISAQDKLFESNRQAGEH